MRRFVAAISFLTRLPVGRRRGFDGPDVGRAAVFFPVVGGLIGGIQGAALWWFGALGATPTLQAVLSTAVMVLITGALHQDALADMADGFGGGRTREDVLRIMRDSVVGSYGAVALILALGTRVLAVSALAEHGTALPWLVAAAALARCGTTYLGCLMSCAREGKSGLGNAVTKHIGVVEVVGATATALLISVCLLGGHTWLAVGVVAGVCAHNALVCGRRIHGVTGDTLGAATEVSEVGVLVLGAALMGAS